MKGALVILHVRGVEDDMAVVFLWRWDAADFPIQGQLDRDVGLAKGKGEVDGMNAVGMLEDMLFRSAEKTDGQNGMFAGSRDPPGHLEIEFGNQFVGVGGPIRAV